MTDKIDAFLAEIRAHPKFIEAAATNPTKVEEFAAMEKGLAILHREPEFVDLFDKLVAVLDRRDLSIKQRLDEISKILLQARDAGRSVN
jgi:hypothetical protein